MKNNVYIHTKTQNMTLEMDSVITGMEPTGHYWLVLAHILKEEQIKFVTVNPLHVKNSKELDDNSPISGTTCG